MNRDLKAKVALITLTDCGLNTLQRIGAGLPKEVKRDYFLHQKALGQNQSNAESSAVDQIQDGFSLFSHLRDLVPRLWQDYSVLIFVMATGIVVRQIASLLESKDQDPAVLVLDEAGKFVIPLLSGHLGGANAWALQIAEQLGAMPVITTATDVRNMVAPDEYARCYGWKVEPVNHLPVVNRLLLDQKCLKVWTRFPLNHKFQTWQDDPHYWFLAEEQKDEANVVIDVFTNSPVKADCLYLVPPMLSVGVGCRRGVDREIILERIKTAMAELGASPKAISGLYSIDLKSDELGLIEAARSLQVPFHTFPADVLQAVNLQEQLDRSNFVSEKIGVDGVCEAASLLGARMGRLIRPKTKGRGVTVAISIESSLS